MCSDCSMHRPEYHHKSCAPDYLGGRGITIDKNENSDFLRFDMEEVFVFQALLDNRNTDILCSECMQNLAGKNGHQVYYGRWHSKYYDASSKDTAWYTDVVQVAEALLEAGAVDKFFVDMAALGLLEWKAM